VDVNAADIKQAPDMGADVATDYIRGLLPADKRMTVLLDVGRLFELK
jgi:chemotaxis signal transduction protein